MSRSADHKAIAKQTCQALSEGTGVPHIAVKGTRKGQKYWLKKPDDEGFRAAYCRRRAPLSDEQKRKRRRMRLKKKYPEKSPGMSFAFLKPRMHYHRGPHMRAVAAAPRKTVIAQPVMSDAAIANLLAKASAATKPPSADPLAMLAAASSRADPMTTRSQAISPRFSASLTYDPRVFKTKKAGVAAVGVGKKFRTINGGKYRKVTKTTAKNLM
jgi:hypothetical protein